MGADISSDQPTLGQNDGSESSEPPVAKDGETDEGMESTAVEVVLPAILAANVFQILQRRGVTLDDLIRDLLTRYVPVVTSASCYLQPGVTQEDASEVERRA